jgi:hypothetical protein
MRAARSLCNWFLLLAQLVVAGFKVIRQRWAVKAVSRIHSKSLSTRFAATEPILVAACILRATIGFDKGHHV